MSYAEGMISTACRYEQFLSTWFADGCRLLSMPAELQIPCSNRKIWEWCAIIEALRERDMLRDGRAGLGFAVGTEKLPAIFANMGVKVLASDAPQAEVEAHWTATGEHASERDALFHPDCISRQTFDKMVDFMPIDMNCLDALPSEQWDFVWSSCALEHLGTLAAGSEFVKTAMRLIKPGGVAVHTTEINCSSNEETIETGWNVIYRRCDLEKLADDLRTQRCGMEKLDFDLGVHQFDLDYDEEPYFTRGNPHIKLKIGHFVSTSQLLVIQKA